MQNNKVSIGQILINAVCALTAFLAMVMLFASAIVFTAGETVLNTDFAKAKIEQTGFADSAKSALREQIYTMFSERGIDERTADACFDFEQADTVIDSEISAYYTSKTAEFDISGFKDKLMQKLREHLVSGEITDAQAKTLDEFADSITDIYTRYAAQSFANSYRNISTGYRPYLLIAALALALVAVLLSVALLFMRRKKYLGMFWISVTVLAAAICCAVLSAAVDISGIAGMISVSPQYLGDLISAVVCGMRDTLYVIAAAFALLGTGGALLSFKLRSKALRDI